MLGRFFNKAIKDATKSLRTYAGDTAFLNAAVAVAANVTAADGEIEEAETKKAKKVIIEHPIVAPSFSGAEIEAAIDAALDRAETRGGRRVNSDLIEAMKGRDQADRDALFLIGADVADVGGIGDAEDAALTKIAELLGVNKKALLD